MKTQPNLAIRTAGRLAFCLLPFAFCLVASAAAPTDAEIREAYHKSYRYEKAQNYSDAIKSLAPIITAFPQAYTVNLRLGWLNYLTGSFATSRTHYLAAIKAAPDSIEAKLGHTLPLVAQEKWDDYSKARDDMLVRTHSADTPWVVVHTDKKPKARSNIMRHVLRALAPEVIAKTVPKPDSDLLYTFDTAALTDGRLER